MCGYNTGFKMVENSLNNYLFLLFEKPAFHVFDDVVYKYFTIVFHLVSDFLCIFEKVPIYLRGW